MIREVIGRYPLRLHPESRTQLLVILAAHAGIQLVLAPHVVVVECGIGQIVLTVELSPVDISLRPYPGGAELCTLRGIV